jgi:hypothetical protein
MSDGYLFSKETVRFELRGHDVLAVPEQLQVASVGNRVALSVAGVRVELDAARVTVAECQSMLRYIDGEKTLDQIRRSAGVNGQALDALLHGAFGIVIFAPFAVTELEHQLSGLEIVRFPCAPYEIVRSYWENQIDVARALSRDIERLGDSKQFLKVLTRLHGVLLRGESGQSIYTPASPIARKGVDPGQLLDSPAQFVDTANGPVLMKGAKVNASLLGGDDYNRIVFESVGEPDALSSDRELVDGAGLNWGRLITAGTREDPKPEPLFIPPRPIQPAQVAALCASLGSAWRAAQQDQGALVLAHLARFHQRFVRLHPFQCANQSLAMALVNFVLRSFQGSGVAHLVLDHFALRTSENSYARLFARAVVAQRTPGASLAQRYHLLRGLKQRSYALLEAVARASDNALDNASVWELCMADPEAARLLLLSD